jgi:hypothetical protein
MDEILLAIGLRQGSALVGAAAQVDFLYSLVFFAGAIILGSWISMMVLLDVARRQWDAFQRHLFWSVILLLAGMYFASSVVNAMDTLGMLPP